MQYSIDGKIFNKIYIDARSLMHPGFERFIMQHHVKLSIPYSFIKELRYLCESTERSECAKKVLENIYSGIIEAEIDGHDMPTKSPYTYILMNVLQSRLSKLEKVLVITQDYNLALDILTLNGIRTQWGPAANVKKITHAGMLENFDLSKLSNTPAKQHETTAILKRFGL